MLMIYSFSCHRLMFTIETIQHIRESLPSHQSISHTWFSRHLNPSLAHLSARLFRAPTHTSSGMVCTGFSEPILPVTSPSHLRPGKWQCFLSDSCFDGSLPGFCLHGSWIAMLLDYSAVEFILWNSSCWDYFLYKTRKKLMLPFLTYH